jgi:exonuclease VII small subunit
VKDFIEDLSNAAIPTARRSGTLANQHTFDPKPLIRTFEHALTRLNNLSEDLEEKENELSGAVRRAEAQHNQNVESLGRRLEQAIDRFQKLDSTLNGNDEGGPDAGASVSDWRSWTASGSAPWTQSS